MDHNSADSADLIERARAGDGEALNALFARHRDRLHRMVEMRLDPRLQARLDASDVLQAAFVEVIERLDDYLRDPKLPLFLWLRLVVGERLVRLGTRVKRSVFFSAGGQSRRAGRQQGGAVERDFAAGIAAAVTYSAPATTVS